MYICGAMYITFKAWLKKNTLFLILLSSEEGGKIF